MTFLANKLKERIQIRLVIQDHNNDNAGFDRTYETIKTIWGGMKALSFVGRGGDYIRGQQVNDQIATTIFTFRRNSFDSLGNSFSLGFGEGFFSSSDLNTLKSNYFLFVERGSVVRGRLFKILGIVDKDERREFIKVTATEIEEQGTGYQA